MPSIVGLPTTATLNSSSPADGLVSLFVHGPLDLGDSAHALLAQQADARLERFRQVSVILVLRHANAKS